MTIGSVSDLITWEEEKEIIKFQNIFLNHYAIKQTLKIQNNIFIQCFLHFGNYLNSDRAIIISNLSNEKMVNETIVIFSAIA